METNEPQTEETKKEVEAGEVFRDKPENEMKEEELPENADGSEATEGNKLSPAEETETDPNPKPVEDEEAVEEEAEPLYQRKVYIIDLNNIGLKIEGEGSLIVDVMSIDKETQKATVKNGDLTMVVPKEFLF